MIKKVILSLFVLFSICTGAFAGDAVVVAENTAGFSFKSVSKEVAKASIEKQAQALAALVGGEAKVYDSISIEKNQIFCLISVKDLSSSQVVSELKKSPLVVSAAENYLLEKRKDTIKPKKTSSLVGGVTLAANFESEDEYQKNWGLPFINAYDAWKTTKGSQTPVVCIIDTGIDYNHPDLKDNVGSFVGEYAGCPVIRVATFLNLWGFNLSGKPEETFGIKGELNKSDPDHTIGDYKGHGTAGASIIAGAKNNSGIVGVAPDVKIVGISMLETMYNTDSIDTYDENDIYGKDLYTVGALLSAIDILTDQIDQGLNVKVCNMSLSVEALPSDSVVGILRTAIESLNDRGVMCVISAGNSYYNLNTYSKKFYPACFTTEKDGVISVGNNTNYNVRSTTTNFGTEYVDIMAPGEDVMAANTSYHYNNETHKWEATSSSFATVSGTSFSAPHVTGTMALIYANNPSLTFAEAKAKLANCGDKTYLSDCAKNGILKIGSLFGAVEEDDKEAPQITVSSSNIKAYPGEVKKINIKLSKAGTISFDIVDTATAKAGYLPFDGDNLYYNNNTQEFEEVEIDQSKFFGTSQDIKVTAQYIDGTASTELRIRATIKGKVYEKTVPITVGYGLGEDDSDNTSAVTVKVDETATIKSVLSGDVTFTVSDEAKQYIKVIGNDGNSLIVKGIAAGTTTITATDSEGYFETITIKVTANSSDEDDTSDSGSGGGSSSSSSGGGGGGCNAGMGAAALIFIIPLTAMKVKRKK